MKKQLLSDVLENTLKDRGFDGLSVDPIEKADCGCSNTKYFINLNYKGHPVRIQRSESFWREVLISEEKFGDLVDLSENMLKAIYN